MGREIKRVPVDFDWPLNKIWYGYQNPFWQYRQECPHCKATGLAPKAKFFSDQWYGYVKFDPSETGSQPLTPQTPAVRAFAVRNVTNAPQYYGGFSEGSIIREGERLCKMWNISWSHHLEQADVDALIAKGRLWDFTRNGIPNPTAQQVNEWSIRAMGHDGLNQFICVKAKCERLGVEFECEHCEGHGDYWQSQYQKRLYDEYENIDPPKGDGWQMWETVSEGSPVSPVFATSDEFVAWLISEGYSESNARKFIEVQWTPSMVMINGEVKSNIESLEIDDE